METLRRRLPTIALLPVFALACGDLETDLKDTPAPGVEIKSTLSRNTNPNVSAADAEQLASDNHAFAVDLYQRLRTDDGNLFYSPHSISTALAMTYAGARGATEQEMATALHYSLAQSELHPAFNQLDLELQSRGSGAKAADGGQFRLNVANRLFGQTGYDFLPDFLDTLALNYGAGLSAMDFAADPEGCRDSINEWVEQRTEDRIQDLLPEGSVTADARLVLVNAIYFNAAWRTPFEESATLSKPFHRPAGTVDVPTMQASDGFGYGQIDGAEVISLPYDGDELDMLVILPTAETFEDFDAGFGLAQLEAAADAVQPSLLSLEMPKFEMEYSRGLVPDMRALGMHAAFTDAADFSGMDGDRGLAISEIVHKAFIKVNEAGTEAAAATGVVVGVTSVPEYIPVKINRPFLFFIRDLETGAVLFFGRVVDPSRGAAS